MSYGYTDAYAGEFYRPRTSKNIHTLINWLTTSPVRFWDAESSAVITQEVQFPDISFYQGTVNFSVMRLNTNSVILRIGQNLWKDDEFERNYIEAKKQGMMVGGYWFYDDRVDPGRQAELLLDCILGKTFEMEIYVDWERSYGGPFSGLQNVVAMMQMIDQAKAVGLAKIKGTGMYTGYYWFRGNSNSVANANQYNYLKGKPLWLAWYTSNPANVLIPAPWTSLNIWQYGTPAVDWGQQSSEIDMNWFNGTKSDFEVRYGTIIGEPEMPYMEIKSAVQGNHSIRKPTAYPQTPHIFGSMFATLNYPSTIHANVEDFYVYNSDVFVSGLRRAQAGDKWWKVFVAGVEGWIAEIHLGVRYTTATLVDDNAPTLPTLNIEISDTDGKYNPVTVTLTPK